MTPGLLTVGTDGSCLRNPNGPTGWAYVCDDGRYGSGGRASGTNQIGELMAILSVLRAFADLPLRIESDSAYAIGCSSTWKVGWQRAGYLRKAGPIANLDIIREIHALLDARDSEVRFVKVKAHLVDESVHPLNVRADELAGRAARAAADSRGDFSENGNWLPGVGPVAGADQARTTSPADRRNEPVASSAAPRARAVVTAVEPADGMLF